MNININTFKTLQILQYYVKEDNLTVIIFNYANDIIKNENKLLLYIGDLNKMNTKSINYYYKIKKYYSYIYNLNYSENNEIMKFIPSEIKFVLGRLIGKIITYDYRDIKNIKKYLLKIFEFCFYVGCYNNWVKNSGLTILKDYNYVINSKDMQMKLHYLRKKYENL